MFWQSQLTSLRTTRMCLVHAMSFDFSLGAEEGPPSSLEAVALMKRSGDQRLNRVRSTGCILDLEV